MTEEIRERIGGRPSPTFKGGWLDRGRWRVPVPRETRHLHPTVDKKGYMARAHLVWNTAHPDDPVQRGQVVHHRNGDSLDDRLENLECLPSQAEHARIHFKGKPRRKH
jgi:hypothetical protein